MRRQAAGGSSRTRSGADVGPCAPPVVRLNVLMVHLPQKQIYRFIEPKRHTLYQTDLELV